jgi:pilus assembly protein Flp/PilA
VKRANRSVRTLLAPFVQASNGATSIEYAVIAMLISLAIVGSVTSIGPSVAKFFTNVSSGFGGDSGQTP